VIAEFTRTMDLLGPFEPSPRVAVGVSGGADSLALCLLMKDWTDGRNGSLLALTVDHALRHEAAVEAEQVGAWLKAHGIEHDVLRWEGAKPASGIQAEARDARYRLLTERCHAEGILHLALAHHRQDQAETLLLRLARGSGVDGLSGMAALRESGAVRLLRPLLSIAPDRLRAFLTEAGQPWIEDPSNRSHAYARPRLRGMAEVLAAEGWSAERAADTARRLGRARAALEGVGAGLAAAAVDLWPEGCVLLRSELLRDAQDEPALRVLSRCLAVVGGGCYRPKLQAVERLLDSLRKGGVGRGRTLGGCQVMPYRDGRLLIAREPGAADDRLDLPAGATIRWDGRFTVKSLSRQHATIVRLGLHPEVASDELRKLPAAVRQTLPVVLREDGAAVLPQFDFAFYSKHQDRLSRRAPAAALFRPQEPLSASAFVVV
jgi:tRNA(Ile)-lysidine synthase